LVLHYQFMGLAPPSLSTIPKATELRSSLYSRWEIKNAGL
jgi:hypothetical protein